MALELKYGVTDFNGWQTAYGYDDGRRGRASRARSTFPADFAVRARSSPTRASPAAARDRRRFDRFMALDVVAYAALQRGDDAT